MKNIPLLTISISLLFFFMPYAQAQQGELATIEITASPPLGSPPNIEIGQSVVFTAVGKDAEGNIVPIPDPGWYSDGIHGTITVDPNDPNKCTYTATAEGADYIQCCDGLPGTGVHGSLDFNVVAASSQLVKIEITADPPFGDPPTIEKGQSVEFTAVGKDPDGNVVTISDPQWFSDGVHGTITVDPNDPQKCTYTATAEGADYIQCSDGPPGTGVHDSLDFEVVEPDPPIPTTVTITPKTITIVVGGWISFKVTVRDQNGDEMPDELVTFEAEGGTITPEGVYTGTEVGEHTITVKVISDQTILDTATVTVESSSTGGCRGVQTQSIVKQVLGFSKRLVYDETAAEETTSVGNSPTSESTIQRTPASVVCKTDPVMLSTGDFFCTSVDLSIRGKGINFTWSRSYASGNSDISGTLGYGWRHNYDEIITNDDGEISLSLPFQ